MKEKQYCWSSNEETFNSRCETREEAIKDYFMDDERKIGDVFYLGECCPVTLEDCVPSMDTLLEDMSMAADEKAGEAAEGWPYDDFRVGEYGADALQESLRQMIIKWFESNKMEPSFWGVEEVERIEVDEELMAQFNPPNN